MTNIGGPDSFGSVAGLLTPVRVCSVTAISLLLYTSVSVVLTVCFPTLTHVSLPHLSLVELCDQCCVFACSASACLPARLHKHRWARFHDGGEMRHDQRKNPLSFGPDQFFISFIKKALASVEREIAISLWSAGLLSLFQCGSLEHSPCCSFCFSGGQCHPGANPGLLAVSWDSAFSLVWLHSQQV